MISVHRMAEKLTGFSQARAGSWPLSKQGENFQGVSKLSLMGRDGKGVGVLL